MKEKMIANIIQFLSHKSQKQNIQEAYLPLYFNKTHEFPHKANNWGFHSRKKYPITTNERRWSNLSKKKLVVQDERTTKACITQAFPNEHRRCFLDRQLGIINITSKP